MAAKKKNTTKKAASKKPAAKKPTPKKAAAKPAPAKRAPAKTATKTAVKTPANKKAAKKAAPRRTPPIVIVQETATTIVARVDAGFGNAVFVRGTGEGLNWDRGCRMRCESANEWHFTIESAGGDFEAKLLLNDERWAEGENFAVTASETVVVEPKF